MGEKLSPASHVLGSFLKVKAREVVSYSFKKQRFGTVAAVNGSEGMKKAEELNRKARADRFGVPASSSPTKVDNSEEEAKKKARLSRFGKDTKVDSAEEDKRKARALRFSKPASDPSSDFPEKLDIGKDLGILKWLVLTFFMLQVLEVAVAIEIF